MGEKETTVEETTNSVDSTTMEEKQTEDTTTVEEEKVEETSTPASEENTSKNEDTTTVEEDNKTSEEDDQNKDSSNSELDEKAAELQQLKNENIKLKTAREHNLDDEALKILGEVDETYSTRAKALASLLNKPETKETRRDPNIGVTGSKMWDGNSWLRDTIGV